MPNLPTEDELRYCVRHLKVTAYAAGKPYNVNLATVIQKDDVDALMQLIHHYATKREIEARLDELSDVRDGWHGTDDHEFASKMNARLDKLLAELKAQKEQENK